METKTGEVSIKQTGEGKATVVIATLGVRDKDGDVLLAGAFGDQVVPVVGAHEWRSVPIGKAHIREIGQEAVADIEFNTQTTIGNDWYQAIKFDWEHPPARQQYSWGFTVGPHNAKSGQHNGQMVRFLGASEDGNPLQIHEVSPVLLAAGTNTRSLSVKENELQSTADDRPMPVPETRRVEAEKSTPVTSPSPSVLWHVVGVHHTGLDDSPFEAVRHYKRLQASQAAGLYRSAFAVQWPGTPTEMKESWGLLHHVIDDDGKPGAASLHACLVGMSLLKGWDGVFIPEHVREDLYAHYAAHLHDGGYDVPELLKRDSGIEIKHELKFWLWLAKSVIDRRERVQEFLIRVGKEESKDLVDQFDQLFRYVTHMHGIAGSAGDAVRHMEEQEELSTRAQQITQELAEETLREDEAKQAELRELFERFRVNHG